MSVQPQVFDLLEYLIRNRGHVVSRDDLLDAIWGGRIVSESTLATRINAARSAIGDDGESQRLIRTLSRKGLRFVGDVREENPVSASGEVPGANPAFALPDRPSIAVLPFTNISSDSEQDYFAEGITDDIITALSHWRWLFVIARNSTFAYRGRDVDVKQVGDELGVRYVLEGSVRRSADSVRITAQLVEATTRAHLWANRYDRVLDDLFKVQDDITAAISATLTTRSGNRRPKSAKARNRVGMSAVPQAASATNGYGDLVAGPDLQRSAWATRLEQGCNLDFRHECC